MISSGDLTVCELVEYTEADLDIMWDNRVRKWESILDEQFDLAYYGHLPPDYIEEASILERKYLYERLLKVKKEEREARDKALASLS